MNLFVLLAEGLVRLLALVPIFWMTSAGLNGNYKKLLLICSFLFMLDTIFFDVLLVDGLKWNWLGHAGRLLWTTCFIYNTTLVTKQNAGWTFSIRNAKTVFTLIASLILLRLTLRYVFQGFPAYYNFETFCYEATLPGISEEILFRGILLGLLNKVYIAKWTVMNTKIGWGLIITSILFGLIHGLSLSSSWRLDFNSQKFVMTGALGFVLGFIKEKSGSVVPGMVAHNLWNIIAYWGR